MLSGTALTLHHTFGSLQCHSTLAAASRHTHATSIAEALTHMQNTMPVRKLLTLAKRIAHLYSAFMEFTCSAHDVLNFAHGQERLT